VNTKHFTMRILSWLALAASLSLSSLASASEGHDHGNDAPANQGEASPRFDAHSDLFELVGVAQNGQLTIYLDRYASNEPVTDAKIEFESGDAKGVAQRQADGTYRIALEALQKPGHIPLSFTVTAGADTDLLAGELVIADTHVDEAPAARPWGRWAGWGAAALALLAFGVAVIRRLVRRPQGAQA
jgi:cobalt-zinc-cadmium efflux system membrane fusion protein